MFGLLSLSVSDSCAAVPPAASWFPSVTLSPGKEPYMSTHLDGASEAGRGGNAESAAWNPPWNLVGASPTPQRLATGGKRVLRSHRRRWHEA